MVNPTEDAGPGTEDAPSDVTAQGDPDVTADDTDSDDGGGDPLEDAIRARLDLERERILGEVKNEVLAQREAEEQGRRRSAEASRLRDAFGDATKEARSAWHSLKVYDEDGNPAALPDDLFERIVAQPYQRYNATAQDVAQGLVLSHLAEAAMSTLPAEAREEFARRAANRPLEEWLDTYSELRAPHTSSAKTLSKELEAKLKAERARGYRDGQRQPPGPPKQVNESGTPQSIDRNTISGMARAHAQGQIPDAEYVEFLRKQGVL